MEVLLIQTKLCMTSFPQIKGSYLLDVFYTCFATQVCGFPISLSLVNTENVFSKALVHIATDFCYKCRLNRKVHACLHV